MSRTCHWLIVTIWLNYFYLFPDIYIHNRPQQLASNGTTWNVVYFLEVTFLLTQTFLSSPVCLFVISLRQQQSVFVYPRPSFSSWHGVTVALLMGLCLRTGLIAPTEWHHVTQSRPPVAGGHGGREGKMPPDSSITTQTHNNWIIYCN